MHVQAFLHAVLFPSVRLLVAHPQQTRSRTLTVAVTNEGTNAHNCSNYSFQIIIFPALMSISGGLLNLLLISKVSNFRGEIIKTITTNSILLFVRNIHLVFKLTYLLFCELSYSDIAERNSLWTLGICFICLQAYF